MNNKKSGNNLLSFPKILIAMSVAITAGPAMAQAPLVLEEVLVTAQKRVQSVQDISGTVNVISGDAIEKFSALTFQDLETQTAGLSLSSKSARQTNISMRGISIDPEAGAANAVDAYWNEASVRQDVAFSQLYDIERVEILRGPQGTLQGATSPAGAINLITKRPDLFESSGYVQLTAGSNDGLNTQAAYSAPIIEGKLGVRVAGVYNESDAGNIENTTTGLDNPKGDAQSARLSVNWVPTDDLDISLIYQYLDRETDDNRAVAGGGGLNQRSSLQADDDTALGKFNNFGNFESDITNLAINWYLGDLELTSVSAYQTSEKVSGTENDRANYITNPAALTHQLTTTNVDSFSQELRLSSNGNEFWNYMVGLYYNDQKTSTEFVSNTTQLFGPAGISFSTDGYLPVNSKELAVFTFNTLELTEDLQLEVGLRWTEYERFRAGTINFGQINDLPPVPFLQQIALFIPRAFPLEAISVKNQETKENAITGAVKLRYALSDDMSIYTAYNRGYRPSGISIVPSPNVRFLPNREDDLLHDEEISNAIEVGFKSRLLDGRATLNGAVYYQQFDDYLGFTRGVQVIGAVQGRTGPVDLAGGLIFNGDATIYGLELEGQMLLTESWVAGASFSYAKGEWDDGATKPCNQRNPGEVLGSCDIEGDAISGEPELSLSLNSEYTWSLENTEIYLRGLYKFTDDRLNTEASAGIGNVTDFYDAYSVLNLYIGWRSSDNQWDITVFAKNVLDDDTVNFQQGPDQYDLALSGGDGSYTQVNLVPERVVGMTVLYNL